MINFRDKTSFELNPYQQAFYDSRKENILLTGEFGSGKTSIACLKIHKMMLENPGILIAIFRNISGELESSTVPEYMELIFGNRIGPLDPAYYWHSTRKHLRYPNGSEIRFFAVDKPHQIGQLKNLKLGGLWMDQAEEIIKDVFDLAGGRVRQTNVLNQKLYTCNTEGGDHYLKDLFFRTPLKTKTKEIKICGDKHKVQYGYWQGINNSFLGITPEPMINRKHLKKNYYEDMYITYSNDWVQKYILGNWFGNVGMIYDLTAHNYFEKIKRPQYGERMIGNDYGISNTSPMVLLDILIENGIYWVNSEFYEFDSSIDNAVTAFIGINKTYNFESFVNIGCKRMFQKEGTSQGLSGDGELLGKLTPAFLFAQKGLNFAPFNIEIQVRRSIIQPLFKNGQIKIHESCVNLISELKEFKYKNEKTASNHAIEALERTISFHFLSNQSRALNRSLNMPVNKMQLRETFMNRKF